MSYHHVVSDADLKAARIALGLDQKPKQRGGQPQHLKLGWEFTLSVGDKDFLTTGREKVVVFIQTMDREIAWDMATRCAPPGKRFLCVLDAIYFN